MEMFPPIDPDAERVLVFNFVNDLDPNEVMVGGPTVKITLSAGTDPNPQNIFLFPCAYDGTGTLILQPVGNLGLLNGNDYELEALSATTSVNKVVVIRALLQVRT